MFKKILGYILFGILLGTIGYTFYHCWDIFLIIYIEGVIFAFLLSGMALHFKIKKLFSKKVGKEVLKSWFLLIQAIDEYYQGRIK